jgi:hypothetical protein
MDDKTKAVFTAHIRSIVKTAHECPDKEQRDYACRTLCAMALIRAGHGLEEYETAVALADIPQDGARH